MATNDFNCSLETKRTFGVLQLYRQILTTLCGHRPIEPATTALPSRNTRYTFNRLPIMDLAQGNNIYWITNRSRLTASIICRRMLPFPRSRRADCNFAARGMKSFLVPHNNFYDSYSGQRNDNDDGHEIKPTGSGNHKCFYICRGARDRGALVRRRRREMLIIC